MTATKRTIGFVGCEGLMALDLVGPMDAFASANDLQAGNVPGDQYELVVIGIDERPFRAGSGLAFLPHCGLNDAPQLDTLIIPGGIGMRSPEAIAALAPWLKARAGNIRRVASVCTGIYALAETGLLDGRRVTTHWSHARQVAMRYPKLRVDADAIFIRDNRFYTSAGITAGIDLALALIEEDFGPKLALSVARELVVYLKRSGGQEQYSEPLRFQSRSTDRFAEIAAWITSHLDRDLSVEALADQACLSPRQFSRRFKTVFGTTPADFVDEMRLNAARHRLSEIDHAIDFVAQSVGFRSADVFRRAFERRFGVTPSAYRARFANENSGQKYEHALTA